jgi:hypothetical protein
MLFSLLDYLSSIFSFQPHRPYQIEYQQTYETYNTYNSEEEEICSICLSDFKREYSSCYCNNIITLNCGHIFHKTCLKIWLERRRVCPLCIRNISENI